MRIAIDGRELLGRPTGVGRYLSRLLATWSGLPQASLHEFILYAPERPSGERTATARLSWSGARVRTVPGSGGTWWEQVHLSRAVRGDRPDVLFAPAYTAPLAAGIPTVLTIHDLSFMAHPEWFPVRVRTRRRIITASAARRARLVLTDSAFSRDEIVRWIRVPQERVRVIPLGLTPPGGGSRPAEGLGREPLVLFVGSIFNRRHLPETIRAVAEVGLRHPEVRFEIVGDNRTHPHQDLEAVARTAGFGERTAIRSYLADDELADLYARAGVFVFLSDYEGFGLTPLEALSCGVPVVAGDTPVAREIYGEAARFVRTTDIAAAASALEALLFDTDARREVLSRASAVLARYSWERAGIQTLAALVEAGGARR